jgi:transcriptional regulator with XRE-family HTH domain
MMFRCLFRFVQTVPVPLSSRYPINPQTLGEHLTKRRMDLGWSKRDVSRYLGITFSTLYTWESGQFIPCIRHFTRIREYLGYSWWQFDMTTLSGQIQDYRHTHGLTSREFGKLVGVYGVTVRAWELQKFQPSIETVLKLKVILKKAKPLE